ncbi:hypothetical protein [Candidatus Desulforudis audaxviator]|uniref:Uncharacterized protein n=1 Tax=Desulforudis audaxviator (strain MP104C) TaxID=477974 RepID=B1I2A7_DESAP|nr:hypothetical protein [Candidatus Desulforudis audaxviator]ACA59060.1 hypothetical protein Daud_0514 [Candidatus Desulforudis audaxviator MP104C]
MEDDVLMMRFWIITVPALAAFVWGGVWGTIKRWSMEKVRLFGLVIVTIYLPVFTVWVMQAPWWWGVIVAVIVPPVAWYYVGGFQSLYEADILGLRKEREEKKKREEERKKREENERQQEK